MAKFQFKLNENILPMAEIGPRVSRKEVQETYDRKRRQGIGRQKATRLTEDALQIWDLHVSSDGKVESFVNEEFCAEAAPRGFVAYQDGIFRGYVHKTSGEGLRDMHKDGRCPSDCPYCRGEDKQAEQTAEHAGMKAKATAQHWKSGRA